LITLFTGLIFGKKLQSSALRTIFQVQGSDKRKRIMYERARNGIFPPTSNE
jgi:hypothetical protein